MSRNNIFSASEVNLLIELIEKHKAIIECKKTDAINSQKKESAWNAITLEFNANSEVKRDAKDLKKKYFNIKYKVKAKVDANKKSLYGTGGGPATESALSGVEERMLDVLHPKEVNGLSTIYDTDEQPGQELVQEPTSKSPVASLDAEFTPLSKPGPAVLRSKRDKRLMPQKTDKSTKWAELASIKAKWTEEALKTDITNKNKVTEEQLSLINLQKRLLQEEHDVKMKILEAQLVKELADIN